MGWGGFPGLRLALLGVVGAAGVVGAFAVGAPSSHASGQTVTGSGTEPTLTVTGVGFRSVYLKQTAFGGNAVVEYGPTTDYGSTCCPLNGEVSFITPPVLDDGTTYHFRVVSPDLQYIYSTDATGTTLKSGPPLFDWHTPLTYLDNGGCFEGVLEINSKGYDTYWYATVGANASNPTYTSPTQKFDAFDQDILVWGAGTELLYCPLVPNRPPVMYVQIHASNAKGTTDGSVMTVTISTTTTGTTSTPTTTASAPPDTTTTAATPTATQPTTTAATTTAPTTTAGAPAPQHLILPNTIRTPGVSNPAVRQQTITKTICRPGWIAEIRPSATVTDRLKRQQMRQYHETGNPSAYEEDHLIPLDLGGAPTSPKNLWPEPHTQALHSNPLETRLRRNVCAGKLTLASARQQILKYKRAHG